MTIKEIINSHTYTVDHWLLYRLEEEFNKGTYSKRENVDALALELTLKKEGKIDTLDKLPNESYQWRHDWAYTDEILIDLKRRPNWSSNYSLSGIHKMLDSYNKGQLTHIVGFSQNIETNYKIGDVLNFTFEGILPVKEAIQKSKNKGPFNLLAKYCLHEEEFVV